MLFRSHLIYMSTDTHQLIDGEPKDPIVWEYLRRDSVRVSYLGDRPDVRALSVEQIDALFYDWNHLDIEGHRLWGKMIGEDIKKILEVSRR